MSDVKWITVRPFQLADTSEKSMEGYAGFYARKRLPVPANCHTYPVFVGDVGKLVPTPTVEGLRPGENLRVGAKVVFRRPPYATFWAESTGNNGWERWSNSFAEDMDSVVEELEGTVCTLEEITSHGVHIAGWGYSWPKCFFTLVKEDV